MMRRRSNYIRVDVEVDVSDVLDEMSEDDLLDELSARNVDLAKAEVLGAHFRDDLAEAHCLLMGGHSAAALAILDKLVYPAPPLNRHELKAMLKSRPGKAAYGLT